MSDKKHYTNAEKIKFWEDELHNNDKALEIISKQINARNAWIKERIKALKEAKKTGTKES